MGKGEARVGAFVNVKGENPPLRVHDERLRFRAFPNDFATTSTRDKKKREREEEYRSELFIIELRVSE